MISNKQICVGLLLPLLAGCSSSSSSSTSKCTAAGFNPTTLANVGSAGTNPNVMQVTVNGALCGPAAYQYANEPCVSVTICSPSQPTNCQIISNLLLDTGSYGLRIFSSAITVPLTAITNGSQNLAECVQYGDGSSQWGQVEYAYVKLGNEPAVNMPILVINSSYATPPDVCSSSQSTPDTGPEQAGFNGILGVGLFAQDCGADCVSDPGNGQYYTCNGTDCSCGATVALAAQVQNPVSLLPSENNGVVLDLPAVGSTSGTTSVDGTLYLGIGTLANNTPVGTPLPTTYAADTNGNMLTVFAAYSATAMSSFIDSGSSSLFFPPPSDATILPDCSTTWGPGWSGAYCPATVQTLSAVNEGYSGTPTGTVSFQVWNSYDIAISTNSVFADYGNNVLSSYSSSATFDWGLPFFFGQKTYVGIDGVSSSLGTGPYWAY